MTAYVSKKCLGEAKPKNLNLEIKKKDFALASSTLNNIKKKELLIDLIKDIKNIDEATEDSSLHYSLKKLIKKQI